MTGRIVTRPAPPVKGRPRCQNCGKPLRPQMAIVKAADYRDPKSKHVTEWNGCYHSYGFFCSLICCEQFANAAYRSGYQRTK